MPTMITANNIEVSYQLDGPDDRPVVMLSNSLMSNYTMWNAQLEPLLKNYRVLRYDQRGHGGTETTPGPYTIKLLADDANDLIETLGIGPVHFVGLSMGGFTGQMLAVMYPDQVLSLALCDTACIMPPESLWNERIEVAQTKGIEALMPGTLERWFTPSFHQADREQLEKVKEMILGTGVDGYIACAEAIRDMSICENLADITVPTLVLVGEADPACPVASAEVLHEGIQGSELVVISQAAHLPNIEQTAVFNETLVNFLDRQT